MEEAISQRLKFVRKKYKLSQTEFANQLEISLSNYQAMERGKRDLNVKTIAAIKKEFDISADWLLFGEDSRRDDEGMQKHDDDIIQQIENYSRIIHRTYQNLVSIRILLTFITNKGAGNYTKDLKDLSNNYMLIDGKYLNDRLGAYFTGLDYPTEITLNNGKTKVLEIEELSNSKTNKSKYLLDMLDNCNYMLSDFDNLFVRFKNTYREENDF